MVTDNGPKYPNQQLKAVTLEAHFPGRFAAWASLQELQAEVEPELPNLFVPSGQTGAETPLLLPFQFRDVAATESLAVALNQVAYLSFQYPGYETFSRRALDLLGRALSRAGVRTLNRVAFRYENEIGLQRDEHGLLPVGRIVQLPTWISENPSQLELAWEVPWAEMLTSRTGVQLRVESTVGAEVLKISICSLLAPAGSIEELARFADQVHEQANACFEAMITQDFRTIISSPRSEGA